MVLVSELLTPFSTMGPISGTHPTFERNGGKTNFFIWFLQHICHNLTKEFLSLLVIDKLLLGIFVLQSSHNRQHNVFKRRDRMLSSVRPVF